MQVYGRSLSNDAAKIRVVTLAFKGTAARWITLYNSDAAEVQNFNQFMTTLRHEFEDCLADCKAQDQIKTIKQGC